MTKIATKPERIPELFTAFWNERDAEGIASLFTEDAEFVNVVGLWWHNREDIRKAHDYGLKVIFNQSELKLTRVKIKKLSDEVVVVHAKMRLTGQSSLEGEEKPHVRYNIFTFVTHREQEKWLAVAAHNTDIVPGKETNLSDGSGILKAVDYRKKSN
ncbi:SgcJ/EcaC family oxidoreductase [Fulvivirga sp. RKSG066]|uniref:SgcJ/EcaC family oxidoreductase n=1 Tax=Fulvivirga aurantia TaxID=2529383 RepID=UPI0012BC5EEF|nr:SgcJ/EcaC family oxidoreductase [Fulvivirga aurantia]MTI23045.1 SgcJ/EcaC family oxidoreductase [Fulvivirga aurantia]